MHGLPKTTQKAKTTSTNGAATTKRSWMASSSRSGGASATTSNERPTSLLCSVQFSAVLLTLLRRGHTCAVPSFGWATSTSVWTCQTTRCAPAAPLATSRPCLPSTRYGATVACNWKKRNAPWGAQRMRRRGAVLCALQLRLVQEKGLAFVGMIEPEITFLPTYKYDNGTNNYDTRCVGWVGRRSTANAGPLTLPCDGRRLGPQRKDADSRMVRPHPVQG